MNFNRFMRLLLFIIYCLSYALTFWVTCLSCPFSHFQQYNYQNDDSPPHDQGFLRLTSEVTPELVHVSEKNLSEIENVHGYVSHSHISPLKVSRPELPLYPYKWPSRNYCEGRDLVLSFFPLSICLFSCHLICICIYFFYFLFIHFIQQISKQSRIWFHVLIHGTDRTFPTFTSLFLRL